MRTGTFIFCVLLISVHAGVYEWMTYDNFDRIIDKMDAVNEENCMEKSTQELFLPNDVVEQAVQANKLKTSDFIANYYYNRTSFLQMHSVALSNAYKYSYLFQRLNQTWNFKDQPSLFYYYLGLTADATANLGLINASATFFDQNYFYPNFLVKVALNNTIPLFGPRSWRIDDYNDPSNWLREPTNNTFDVTDYGAGPAGNYTTDAYKINQWYKFWLPQPWNENNARKVAEISLSQTKAKSAGVFDDQSKFAFYGPPLPYINNELNELPVKFTAPYFDCGRSNKWIVSAVAPIVDRVPRYMYDIDLNDNFTAGVWENDRRNIRVGVAVTDTDFLMIDYDPCPTYYEQDGTQMHQSYLSGTDRCDRETTICKPLPRFGFQRGGYFCECKPGYRYPEYIQGPYLGVAIERATADEYKAGFKCIPVGDMYTPLSRNQEEIDNQGRGRVDGTIELVPRGKRSVEEENLNRVRAAVTKYADTKKRFLRRVIPRDYSTLREVKEALYREKRVASLDGIPQSVLRDFALADSDLGLGDAGRRLVARYKRSERKKRSAFNPLTYRDVETIMGQKNSISKDNCLERPPEDWVLPGNVKFGVEWKLERFGRIALRLSDFISSFLQVVDGRQVYGTLRGDKLLKEEQVFAEVSSVVLADPDVEGFGVFFDRDAFTSMDTDDNVYTKELFAPYAYVLEDLQGDNFFVIDRAGDAESYVDYDWFQNIKRRWSYNTEGLKTYVLNPYIRTNENGTGIQRHEEYPLKWQAAVYESGVWSDPYFDCKGYLRDWVISYRVPFFGNRGYGSKAEFRGVVSIDVRLNLLDIEQCPSEFFSSNAFMGTARCDYETTYCMPIENQGFQLHNGYRCDCKQGYEFPWQGGQYFYTGDVIEQEKEYYETDQNNRYKRVKCRMSAADRPIVSLVSLLAVAGLLAI